MCGAGLVAVGYGLVVAPRMHGAARWWRLLAVGAVASLLAGQLTWWFSGADSLPVWAVLYWLFVVLGLASILVLALFGGRVVVPQDGSLTHAAVLTLLDG